MLHFVRFGRNLIMKTVCVVGLGYVGLPTAVLAAQNGYQVVGFDIDKEKVKRINVGDVDITEPELKERLRVVLGNKSFRATTTLPEADFFIVAVPTPLSKQNGADLSFVFSAADIVIKKLKVGDTVILESTIPVGTTDLFAQMLEQKSGLKVGDDFFVAHCPERVWPSKVFEELVKNERIIGGVTEKCAEKAVCFYRKFVKGTMHLKSAKFAELLKLTENSAIDVSVALAHQVAVLAEELKFDPYEVIAIANKHPRVKILTPTCGVGGHCVAIDPWFLINSFPHKTHLFQSARLMNDERPHQVVKSVELQVCGWCTKNEKKICRVHLLGLTYKPNVDDLRESPAILIAGALFNRQDIDLSLSEPNVSVEIIKNKFGNVVSLENGIKKADIVVGLVAHNQFKSIDLQRYIDKEWMDFAGLGWQQQLNNIKKINVEKEMELNL